MPAYKAALESFVKVCRTASTLYELMVYYRLVGGLTAATEADVKLLGFGNAMKKAIGGWFLGKTPMEVAVQVHMYPSPPSFTPPPPFTHTM